MRVAVLNDLPVAGVGTGGFGSGAELTIARFVRAGYERGHTVDVVCPEFAQEPLLASYDLILTKNVTNFDRQLLERLRKAPHGYVNWPSDYCWYRWRLFFGFQEQHHRLPDLAYWTDFFRHSRLNVFLSPLHRRAYEWMMPEVASRPAFLSPPPVDEASFAPSKEGYVPNTACTINGGLPFKGLKPTLTWVYEHPEVKFTFIGALREQVELPPNAQHIGSVPQGKLAEILGRTETYVELPDTVQPYNQTAVQGFLSCKRVVTNELLGAASWPWFQKADRGEAREVLRGTLPHFWERLEQEGAAA